MTKFNWERANARDRYLRSVFRAADLERTLQGALAEQIEGTARRLGLSDEDCLGQVPNQEKRRAIFWYMLEKNASLRCRYESTWAGQSRNAPISSRKFIEFSHHVLLDSLTGEAIFAPPIRSTPWRCASRSAC